MSVPSVKGILLSATVAGIQAALAEGRTSRVQLEVQLDADQIPCLDEKLDPTRWYPVTLIGRMAEVLAGIMGGMPDEAQRKLGAAGVAIIRESGTYPQADFQPGSLVGASPTEIRAFARVTASVWPAMYDFGRTRVEWEEQTGAVVVHYEDVAACPESVRHTIEGFTAEVARIASDGHAQVTGERPSPDHFLTRIVLGGS
ncbi:MAG: hypothetical protein ACQGVK_01535 [Myxococcota bacterium]